MSFMSKKVFTKQPLSIKGQINLLKSRGLQIPDEGQAAQYLQNISYYRLSGYMYPFLADVKQHRYKAGAVFEDILNLYHFDRELRLLVFSAIERIEAESQRSCCEIPYCSFSCYGFSAQLAQ